MGVRIWGEQGVRGVGEVEIGIQGLGLVGKKGKERKLKIQEVFLKIFYFIILGDYGGQGLRVFSKSVDFTVQI